MLMWARTAPKMMLPSSLSSKDAVLDSPELSASMSAQQRVAKAGGERRTWGTSGTARGSDWRQPPRSEAADTAKRGLGANASQ